MDVQAAGHVAMSERDFDFIHSRPRSRWADIVAKLKAAKTGAVFAEKLREDQNNGRDRQIARQSLHAIAKVYRMRVSVTIRERMVLVKKVDDLPAPPKRT